MHKLLLSSSPDPYFSLSMIFLNLLKEPLLRKKKLYYQKSIDNIASKTSAMHSGRWGSPKRDKLFLKTIALSFLSHGNSFCQNLYTIPKCIAKNENPISSILVKH